MKTEPDLVAVQQLLSQSPYYGDLGVIARSVSLGEGHAVFALPYQQKLARMSGSAQFHGGVISALADIAGAALIGILYESPCASIEISVDYLATAAGDELVATALIRKVGKRVNLVDVEICVLDRVIALARCRYATPQGGLSLDTERFSTVIQGASGKTI